MRGASLLVAAVLLWPWPLAAGEPACVGRGWQVLDRLRSYDGDDLGCSLAGDSATFKLWAPRSTKVDLILFSAADQTEEVGRRSMVLGDHGVWSVVVTPADVSGVSTVEGLYYQYEVTNPGREPRRVLDPYARSMAPVTVSSSGLSAGSSGDFVGKGAVVDPGRVAPVRPFPGVAGYARREDAIIWEIHVRDFTSDPSLEGSLSGRWGTFTAFVDRLPYIRSLGVTHVQLLPVNAWYFGDETAMGRRELGYSAGGNGYNWGYDPQNYFSLDGAYSENPEDPYRRIREFRRLVDAVHDAGLGVILDVVYTHMAKASFLDDIVPGYFFFRGPDGAFLGDFGCNLATNRRMAEKLMVDSVAYWFAEYGVDGMRWDMMGDASREAVAEAFAAARAINPRAIFIGEGWRTFKGHRDSPSLAGQGADQDWMAVTDDVGVFSDELRNELKSGFGCEGEPRFLTGGPRDVGALFATLTARPSNTPADAPGDMVEYIAAHDNLPLHDVIAQSVRKDPEVQANEAEIHRRIRLGNLMVLTAQGTAFLHGGQEYGRTKQWLAPGTPEQKFHTLVDGRGRPFEHPYFIHDSYDASDAVNRFDWAKATDAGRHPGNVTTRDYTRGLVTLRRSSDAFRLPTSALVESNVRLLRAPQIRVRDLVIAWSCRGTDGTTFVVVVNADETSRELTLDADLRGALVVVDGTAADPAGLATTDGFRFVPGGLVLEPLTGVVLRLR